MSENNTIKIKIKKNNYSDGALDFWIYDPEMNAYGEKNAFSDENRLLKYTSEQRELSEFAEEMLGVLLKTYGRMSFVNIEFEGEDKDYKCMKKAGKVWINSKTICTILQNKTIEPTDFKNKIIDIVDRVNKAYMNKIDTSDAAYGLVNCTLQKEPIKINFTTSDNIELLDMANRIEGVIKSRIENVMAFESASLEYRESIKKKMGDESKKLKKYSSEFEKCFFNTYAHLKIKEEIQSNVNRKINDIIKDSKKMETGNYVKFDTVKSKTKEISNNVNKKIEAVFKSLFTSQLMKVWNETVSHFEKSNQLFFNYKTSGINDKFCLDISVDTRNKYYEIISEKLVSKYYKNSKPSFFDRNSVINGIASHYQKKEYTFRIDSVKDYVNHTFDVSSITDSIDRQFALFLKETFFPSYSSYVQEWFKQNKDVVNLENHRQIDSLLLLSDNHKKLITALQTESGKINNMIHVVSDGDEDE